MIPRGIRNNNPGNIRKGNDWRGEIGNQTDTAFEQYESPEYGIRALGKILLSYQRKYGLDTVRKLITRWAPPNENNTDAYVNGVARSLGVAPDDPIRVEEHLPALVVAIIQHENGQQPYPDEVIAAGVGMALEA
ncbi:structural protein [uncultured Desulfovibrio sp.]|uniref:structural protein n=1 Tax=uncultured Desulfovibrio sp. TaxID=167968 RepID=UPI0026282F96|nr:structural protein [uncultured Desulfovibrio sp.]